MAGDGLAILLLCGEHARAHYAFVLATGAAAVGRRVVLFATHDGCRALLADLSGYRADDDSAAARGVATLPELREAAFALGLRLIACEAGLRMAEIDAPLADGVEIAGVVTFLEAARGFQVITL